MPYITSERVAAIRKQIKKEFPSIKFSITREHYSTVKVAILAAPINLQGTDEHSRNYYSVNEFYIHEHYANEPEKLSLFTRLTAIMREGMSTGHEDGDYGYVPGHYIDLKVGEWNKPFQHLS